MSLPPPNSIPTHTLLTFLLCSRKQELAPQRSQSLKVWMQLSYPVANKPTPWLVPLDVYSLGKKKCCHGNLDTPASVHVSGHRDVKGGQGAEAKLPQERLLGLPGALGLLLSTCTEGRATQNLGYPYTPTISHPSLF